MLLTDGTVKTRWATTSQAILPKHLDSTFLYCLVSCEPGEIISSEVSDGFATALYSRLWAWSTNNDWNCGKVSLLCRCELFPEGFRGPLVNYFVNFLRESKPLRCSVQRKRTKKKKKETKSTPNHVSNYAYLLRKADKMFSRTVSRCS